MSLMERMFEKGLLTTFGAFLFLQEKAGEAVRDMIERGRLAPEEGRRFLEDLTNRLEGDAEEIRIKVQDEAEERMRSAGVATEKDLKDLKGRLAKIESRLEDIAAKLE